MSTVPTPLGVGVTTSPAPAPAPAAAPAPSPPSASVPVWPRSAQVASAVLLLAVLALLGRYVYSLHRSPTRPTTLEADAFIFRVDLNRADRAQLMQLPGVGEVLVQRIEAYREEHYGFRSVEELLQVPGIGPATLERLRHLVYIEPVEGEDRAEPPRPQSLARPVRKESSAKPAANKKEDALTQPIDINRATAEELQRLPGIGPTLAGRIVEARKKGPFKTVDDLRRVPGIGPKTLDKLRPHVTVGKE